MAAEQQIRRPWDVSIAAALLAIIGIAVIVVPYEALILDYALAYNVIFGIGATVLLYWILIRLWLLARRDQGPAVLIAASVLLTLLGSVYTELWNTLIVDRPFQQGLDLVMAFTHVTSGALLAIALLKWARTPAWLGWLLVAQVTVEAVEAASGLMLLGDLPVTAGGVLWTVFLGALAVVLVSPIVADRDQTVRASASGI